MTDFKTERDEAAKEYSEPILEVSEHRSSMDASSFTAGANWALQSQLVKQMAEALQSNNQMVMWSLRNKALTAYHEACKEMK